MTTGVAVRERTRLLAPAEEIGLATLRVRIEKFRERLTACGFESEEQLIRQANISRTAWHHIKTGKSKAVNLRVIANIMDALKIASMDDLFEFSPDDPPEHD